MVAGTNLLLKREVLHVLVCVPNAHEAARLHDATTIASTTGSPSLCLPSLVLLPLLIPPRPIQVDARRRTKEPVTVRIDELAILLMVKRLPN